MPHGAEGTPGEFAWMDSIEASIAAKLDSTVASSTYVPSPAAVSAAFDIYMKGPTNVPAWTTSEAITARALGWTIPSGAGSDNTILAAAIAATPAGGTVWLGKRTWTLTAQLAPVCSLKGVGLNPSSGTPTLLDFSGIDGATPAIDLADVSDITLSDFYVTGRAAGAASDIVTTGNCRGVTFSKIIVNTHSTNSAFDLGVTGSLIRSTLTSCTAVGAAFGFSIGASCTSIALTACFGNANTLAGFGIYGTYISLSACAADSNGLWGYVISGKAIGFLGSGAESNGRTAFHHTAGADGVTYMGCRGHANNTLASGFYPSFANVSGAENVTMIGCVETAPNAATSWSVSAPDGTPPTKMTVENSDLAKGVYPTLPQTSITATTATAAPVAGAGGALPATPEGYASVSINGVARKIAYY